MYLKISTPTTFERKQQQQPDLDLMQDKIPFSSNRKKQVMQHIIIINPVLSVSKQTQLASVTASCCPQDGVKLHTGTFKYHVYINTRCAVPTYKFPVDQKRNPKRRIA